MTYKTAETPQGNGGELITAEAFREKYSGKRFSSHTAPKAVLYSFLYECYQQNEDGITRTLYPDIWSIQHKVNTYEDMDSWNGYLGLVEWQRGAFSTAVFMRNALNSNLSDLRNIITSIISGENIRDELGAGIPDSLRLWVESLTLEAYTPQQSGGYVLETLRKNIEAGLRYVKAYNTFVELIAEELKTPEYIIMKVSETGTRRSLEAVNEALSALRDHIAEHRTGEAEGTAPSYFTAWTPEYFRETIKAFEPVGEGLPPIPEEKITDARLGIRQGIKKGQYSWVSLFAGYSSKYWRLDVYGG